MNYGIVSQQQLEEIEKAIQEELIANGVACAMLIDTAGNTIAKCDDGKSSYDTYAFAALAADNFAAMDSMASLVGEQEFSLLYHKGENESIHFSKVDDDLIMVSIFGKQVSLGFLRLKATALTDRIKKICNQK